MNRMPVIIVGAFLAFFLSWVGLVATPYAQIGRAKPDIDDITKDQSPPPLPGTSIQGSAVFASNGCVYCHSQQVRGGNSSDIGSGGADLERGWGARRTVARDYMHDRMAYFGAVRNGPDLSNIGARQPSVDWHYQHLYQPAVVSPGSIMPPFRFLFEKRRIAGQPSADAVKLLPPDLPEPGWEVVPTNEAKLLVEYLLSLKRSTYPLPEAPEEKPPQ